MTLLDGKLQSIIIRRDPWSHRSASSVFQKILSLLTSMNLRFSTAIAAFGCVLLASCYPYDESRNKKPNPNPAQKSVTTPEQQKIKEQRDKLKAEEEKKKKQATEETTTQTTETTPGETTTKPPTEEKRTDYAVANKVPGKEGYVFSPYNNKLVDVRDIPSGTLVQDPTYTGEGKGYFRVP